MEKIKFILKIWTKLATHIRMRDRSVKILQYGSQMLLGFYSAKLSKEMVESLKLTRRTASTSRKAFWLLKSINHVGTMIDMIERYNWDADEGYANFLDILEQIALVVYYWYETLVFFVRVKLVGFTEDDIDSWGNMSWFLEDFVCFIASIIRIILQAKKIDLIRDQISKDRYAMVEIENTNNVIIVRKKGLLQEQLALLKNQFKDSILSIAINIFELGASAEAIDLFKTAFGREIGDAGMGLCGVISSSLILFEFTFQAVRSEVSL